MKCEMVRRILLTDHMDGELGRESRRTIDEHLGSCAGCREFELHAREDISMPFAHAKEVTPPAYLWERIKGEIGPDSKFSINIFPRIANLLREALAQVLNIPRPAGAFAAVTMIIVAILISAPIAHKRALNDYLGEQISFLVKLDSSEANGDSIFDTDIRTGAEYLM